MPDMQREKGGFRRLALALLICAFLIPLTTGTGALPAREAHDGNRSAGAARDLQTIRIKTLHFPDREGTGGEAFRILLPDDWKFAGGVQWVPDNPAMPATIAFSACSPERSAALEVLPSQPFFWTNSPEILAQHPRGTRYYGGEVRPPAQPLEALKDIVIPRFRTNLNGLKYIKEQSLPRLAKGLGAGVFAQRDVTSSSLAARIRIEYTREGIPTEEDIYCVVHMILFHFPSPTGTRTNIMWSISNILSFRWPRGAFDARAPLLETMARSYRMSPEWFNKYSQLVASLVSSRVERLEDVQQIGRILSRARNEISEPVMATYRERQAVIEAMAADFGRASTRVETYADPVNGTEVNLPAGYAGVWTNAGGQYLLSTNAAFDPGQVAGQEKWIPLKPVP